jgi:phage shock protein C
MKMKNIVPKPPASWKGTFEMSGAHTRFYRDKLNGKLLGVCSGIADYTGVDVSFIRVGMIVMTFMTSGAMIPVYILTGIVAPRKPVDLYVNQDDKKFWQGVRQSPARTTRDIRSRFREIDRRLADIETFYTSNNKQLADEIESLR